MIVHLACEGCQHLGLNEGFRHEDVQIVLFMNRLQGVDWSQHMLELPLVTRD